jgi:FkbM family methyltransferase
MRNATATTIRAIVGKNAYRTLSAVRRAHNDALVGHADDARRAALYRRWIRPGELVFDIGANIGNRTRVFAGLGARVVAVEPQQHCYYALRWLFKFQPKVKVICAAASSDNSPKRFTQFETDTTSSLSREWIAATEQSGRFGPRTRVAEFNVRCVKVDDLVRDFGTPVFTKIDVEGHELEVLMGLTSPAGTISFEVTPELRQRSRQCIDRLENLGYRWFQLSFGETMQLGDKWLDVPSMRDCLMEFARFGDVYALSPDVC